MNYLTAEKYSFLSNALEDDTFAIVNFKGFEGISKPYEFNIMLVSESADIDMSEVLKYPARLTFHREEGEDVHFNGTLTEFEQLHQYQDYVFYRTTLVPKLWWLKLTQHNRVILDESVPTFIENTMKDGGLITNDFEFRLQNTYTNIDYVCQYGESHLNFISRWLEREGIYYYFEQTENGEKVIFTDTKISHIDLPMDANLIYSPPSGLDTFQRKEVIKSFTCRQRQLPRKIKLKEYNYERPSLDITGEADVDEDGKGTAYVYGEHFPSSEEGNRLAEIRAEELLCHKSEFFGESTVPFLAPGFTFNLENHFNANFNRKFLIEELSHEGSQTAFLIAGIRGALSDADDKIEYQNNFKAIPADVQYRPNHTATKPQISGTLHAKVDAEGSGDFAELDDQGRYKIRLPFDLNDEHGAGKASSFIRMAQPYSGPGYGVHFPLHKDAEVLLTFVNGDPDRPVIAGAVPNPETASPVTSENQTKSIIRDNYGNEMIFDASQGREHIHLYSPNHESMLEIGKSIVSYTDSDSGTTTFGNTWEFGAGTKVGAWAGDSAEAKLALSFALNAGLGYSAYLVGNQSFGMGCNHSYFKGISTSICDDQVCMSTKKNYFIEADNKVNIIGGSSRKGDGGKTENNTIINLDEDFISLSVGKQVSAAVATPSKDLLARGSSDLSSVESEMKEIFDGAQVSGWDKNAGITHCTSSSVSALASCVAAIATMKKIRENTKFEPAKHNKPHSEITLSDKKIFLGMKPDDDKLSKINMDDKGNIAINSKNKQIVISVGEEGSEITTITLNDNDITLENAKSEIWINKKGNISLTSSKTNQTGVIQIFAKDKVVIDSKQQINLQAPKVVCCKGSFDAKGLVVNP